MYRVCRTYPSESFIHWLWPRQEYLDSPEAVNGLLSQGLLTRLLAEAIAAVDRAVAAGLEGQVRLLVAGRARGDEDFARAFAEAGAGRTARTRRAAEAGARRTRTTAAVVVPHARDLAADHAALGLIVESELGVMLLLFRGEDEVFVAVLALQRLVGERHVDPPGVTSGPTPAIPCEED